MEAADHSKPCRAVVYAANDGYAKLAGVALMSYLRHNPHTEDLVAVILDDGISESNRKRLETVAAQGDCRIEFRDVRDALARLVADDVTGYDNAADKGMTAYGRIFIDVFLPPSVQRAVYFDCDTMVAGNLDGLWAFDLGGKPVGFACDCLRNEYKRVIGCPLAERYFNSGVMLIDRAAWRSRGCERKVLEHIRTVRATYPLVDQDLLNLALRGEIATLPPEFNFLSQLHLYDHADYARVYHLDAANWYDAAAFEAARARPLVHHFCGQTFGRPWFRNSRHPARREYARLLTESPWADEPCPAVRLSVPYRVQLLSCRFLPRWLSVALGALMQKVFLRLTYGV